VFSAEPGPATAAALVPVEGEYYRLLVGHGEVLDTPELPKVEMHHFHFRPDAGMEPFMDQWLRLGGPHHFVINLGNHVARWRRLAEQLDLELVEL
jgi:L-arabinose isomerase